MNWNVFLFVLLAPAAVAAVLLTIGWLFDRMADRYGVNTVMGFVNLSVWVALAAFIGWLSR